MKKGLSKKWLIAVPAILVVLLGGALLSGMTSVEDWGFKSDSRIDALKISSEALGKDMPINVFVPKGYNASKKYPVLYVFHGFGLYDDENQWLQDIFTKETLDAMIDEGRIEPLIIVSPKYDASCGYNTANEKAYDDTLRGYSYGRYEDYIIEEMMPYIESHYSIEGTKEKRYIGGFSGGGNAALFLGFTHNDLFSKIGAHCPGLNVETQLNENPELRAFLYPTEAVRETRDPIYLAKTQDLSGINIMVDSVEGDRWLEGSKQLSAALNEKGVAHLFEINKGYHAPAYLKENAEKYLLFYAGVKPQ